MIFGEGRIKDWYRQALWGPGMSVAARLPITWEHRAFRLLGRSAGLVARRKRMEVEENLRRAFLGGANVGGHSMRATVGHVFASHFANQYESLLFPEG